MMTGGSRLGGATLGVEHDCMCKVSHFLIVVLRLYPLSMMALPSTRVTRQLSMFTYRVAWSSSVSSNATAKCIKDSPKCWCLRTRCPPGR